MLDAEQEAGIGKARPDSDFEVDLTGEGGSSDSDSEAGWEAEVEEEEEERPPAAKKQRGAGGKAAAAAPAGGEEGGEGGSQPAAKKARAKSTTPGQKVGWQVLCRECWLLGGLNPSGGDMVLRKSAWT